MRRRLLEATEKIHILQAEISTQYTALAEHSQVPDSPDRPRETMIALLATRRAEIARLRLQRAQQSTVASPADDSPATLDQAIDAQLEAMLKLVDALLGSREQT